MITQLALGYYNDFLWAPFEPLNISIYAEQSFRNYADFSYLARFLTIRSSKGLLYRCTWSIVLLSLGFLLVFVCYFGYLMFLLRMSLSLDSVNFDYSLNLEPLIYLLINKLNTTKFVISGLPRAISIIRSRHTNLTLWRLL